MIVCASLLAAQAPGASAATAADEAVIGVSMQPCRGVPVQPTDQQKASADPYQSWMHEWLRLDWAQLCRYGPANAQLPAATNKRVVFLGDSITDNWINLDPGLFSGDRLDRGISGQTSGQMLLRFRADVLELHPAVVHILAGTNDVAGNTGATSLAIIEGNIASMAELARAHGVRVIIASILPVAQYGWQSRVQPIDSIKALNDWLRAYAAREHHIYVDYYAVLDDGHGGFKPALAYDGVHPNPAGYAAMHSLAEAAITKALER
ncbi:MAG: SGNH/GDSL hydrolase family protein [Steroidobacteraceae bacterium]